MRTTARIGVTVAKQSTVTIEQIVFSRRGHGQLALLAVVLAHVYAA
jgi:hypothetical protein